jgi:hypothetical protein
MLRRPRRIRHPISVTFVDGYTLVRTSVDYHDLLRPAESAIGFVGRLQRHQIAGLRNMGSCSIPAASTSLLPFNAFLGDTKSPLDTN